MRKKGLTAGVVVGAMVLLAACGSGRPAGAEGALPAQPPESSYASSGYVSEASEPQGVPAGPSQSGHEVNREQDGEVSSPSANREENADMTMNVTVGGSTFTATLEHNPAVDALVGMMETAPVTIQMSDYAGFEKVGALGTSLPASNRQTTTHAGDIVLYQGNQIVIFYGSNSWSYTRLGKIDDRTGWEEALGSGNVTVTFSLGE